MGETTHRREVVIIRHEMHRQAVCGLSSVDNDGRNQIMSGSRPRLLCIR